MNLSSIANKFSQATATDQQSRRSVDQSLFVESALFASTNCVNPKSVVKQIKLIESGVTVLEIVEMKKDGDLTHSWTNVIASLDGRSCAYFKRSSQ